MAERLTWAEIKQRYPTQWVVVSDYLSDDAGGVSGVVSEHGTFSEVRAKCSAITRQVVIRYTGDLGACPPGLIPEDRFVIDGETITDNLTGFIWQRKYPRDEVTYSQALEYAAGLRLAGESDWRLPTASELETIVVTELIRQDGTYWRPPLAPPFVDDASGYVFSSTLLWEDPAVPMIMNVSNGYIFNGSGYLACARCVRGTFRISTKDRWGRRAGP